MAGLTSLCRCSAAVGKYYKSRKQALCFELLEFIKSLLACKYLVRHDKRLEDSLAAQPILL